MKKRLSVLLLLSVFILGAHRGEQYDDIGVSNQYRKSRDIVSDPTPAGACPSCLTNLKNYWAFDGNATDLTGAANGTAEGTVSYTTGKMGQAASFAAGANDRIRFLANNLQEPLGDSTKPFSVSAWVKPAGGHAAGYGTIITDGADSMGYYVKNDGSTTWWTFLATPSGDHLSALGAVPTNSWTYITFTYAGTPSNTWIAYINGVQSNTSTAADLRAYALEAIGGSIGSTPRFNGLIDTVATWTRAVTPAEITTMYNGGNGLAYSSW